MPWSGHWHKATKRQTYPFRRKKNSCQTRIYLDNAREIEYKFRSKEQFVKLANWRLSWKSRYDASRRMVRRGSRARSSGKSGIDYARLGEGLRAAKTVPKGLNGWLRG